MTQLPEIHLSIVQPAGYVHSLGLTDQARYMRWQFRRFGATVTMAKNRLRHDAVNIVFGAHLGFPAEAASRHSCIFVNLEQLGHGGARVSDDYMALLRRAAVVDYDAANVAAYGQKPEDVPLVSFLHAPYLDDGLAPPLEQRPIDLLFFGSMNPRRQAFFAQVEAAGVQVASFDHPIYGEERDHYIRQAKAVLNCHFYDSSRFEQARAFTCLSLGTPVISERGAATLAPAAYDDAVFWLEPGRVTEFFATQFARPAFFDAARTKLDAFRAKDPMEGYADLLAFAAGFHKTMVERRGPVRWAPRQIALGHAEAYRAGWLNATAHDDARADLALDLRKPLALPATLATGDGQVVTLAEGGIERIDLDAAQWPTDRRGAVLHNALRLLQEGGTLGLSGDVDGAWRREAAAFWRQLDTDHRFVLPEQPDGAVHRLTKTALTVRERVLARMQRDDFGGLPADGGTRRTAETPQPELTVLCVSYKRYDNIPILIHSFLTQTVQNWKLLILHDGYDEKMDTILARYRREHPGKIEYRFTEQRFNDYGHTLRDMGLAMVDTDYVLLTNDDNYYCPKFIELMVPPMKSAGADIALCNMIHSHDRPGMRPQPSYMPFETRPVRGSVDIGSFIARSDWARKVGFRDKTHDGDATYFEDLLRCAPQPKLLKVERTLFVHN